MRFLNFACVLLSGVCAGWLMAAESEINGSAIYRFLGGEKVRIIVTPSIGENYEQVVSDDGFLSLSTGTMVNLKGKSVLEAKDVVAKELEQWTSVKHPQVALLIIDLPPRKAYVAGMVRTPMAIVLSPGVPLSLLGALQDSGGITDAGDPTRVNVVRTDAKGKQESFNIDIKKLAQPGSADLGLRLQPGDVVVVPPGETYFLSGEINKTGAVHRAELFLAADEQARVSRVLLGAGGLKPTANRKSIYVLRMKPDGTRQVLPVDLELAGKLGSAPADEGKAAAELEQADPILQDGDIIVAAAATAANSTIAIFGRVKAPGIYPVGEGLKLSRLIAQTGGFTDFAKSSAVTIHRAGKTKQVLKVDVDAIIKDGDFAKDVDLQDGDIIFVSERMF